MDFIFIVIATMSFSILLIYKITNSLGFHLKLKSLLLCAVLAFLVAFIGLRASTYLTRIHLAFMLALVIVAAIAATVYNEYLLRQENKLPVTALVEPAQPKPAPQNLPAADSVLEDTTTEKMDTVPREAVPLEKTSGKSPVRVIPVPASAESRAILLSETSETVPVEKVSEESPEDAAPVLASAESQTTSVAETGEAEPAVRRETVPDEKVSGDSPVNAVPVLASAAPFVKPIETEKTVPTEKTPDEISKESLPVKGWDSLLENMHSLDDFLNQAFDAQQNHDDEQAVFFYQAALKNYHEDSYAPFIVIDLGNIYKAQGAYDQALDCYQQALSLPAVASSDAIREEFKKTLAYLRIVKYILTKHNVLQTPFREIPSDYLREIELLFQKEQAPKIVS